MNERNILIRFLDDCLNYAKWCRTIFQAERFFYQAFGAVSLYVATAYANGNTEEENAAYTLWNDEYRAKLEEVVYGKVSE